MKAPTPSEIKRSYIKHQPQGYFFCADTMSIFGDTMADFRVHNFDANHWRLVRKRPTPAMSIGNGWLFNKVTFEVSMIKT